MYWKLFFKIILDAFLLFGYLFDMTTYLLVPRFAVIKFWLRNVMKNIIITCRSFNSLNEITTFTILNNKTLTKI